MSILLHLVSDAYKNAFDAAVVLSNDSDLLPPIKFVKEDLGKLVGILNPKNTPVLCLRDGSLCKEYSSNCACQ